MTRPTAAALAGRESAEFIRNSLGTWTLVFPVHHAGRHPGRRLLSLNWLIRFRRMLGLFAFFYGTLHLITYVWLDTGFDFPAIVKDVYQRPFITGGIYRVRADDSAGDHLHRRNGSQAGGAPLATAAPADLLQRDRRGDPLLLAGEIRRHCSVRFAVVVGVLLAYRLVVYVLQKRSNPPTGRPLNKNSSHCQTVASCLALICCQRRGRFLHIQYFLAQTQRLRRDFHEFIIGDVFDGLLQA